MMQQNLKNPSQIDQMDWFFSSGRDEVIVPQYQETSDQYLSPHYMSQWKETSTGMTMFGQLDPSVEYCGSNSETSPGCTDDWPEYQVDDYTGGTDQMNDNFFGSMLKDDQTLLENKYHPLPMFNHSDSNTFVPSNNLPPDLKYLEVPSSVLPNSEQRKAAGCESPEEDGQEGEISSFEATTLQELETAMVQLKQETRLSLRDALFRLANNSRPQPLHGQLQSGDFGSTSKYVQQETPRFGEIDFTESENNTFESTIAHLMFNNLNSDPLTH